MFGDGDSLENSMAAPFKCPLTKCEENVSNSTLLSHLLKVHKHVDNGIAVKEVKAGEKVSLRVPMTDAYLEIEKNVCLGILVYGMEEVKHSNELLSMESESYQHHIPILIMTCRGNYVKLFNDDADFIDPDANFLTIWLVMPETESKQKISAKLTVFDEDLKKSLSSLIRVRHAKDSQEVRQFMQTETDFLTINSGFLHQITTKEKIYVEISDVENSL